MQAVKRFVTSSDYDFGSGLATDHEVGEGLLTGAALLPSGAVLCWSSAFEFARVVPAHQLVFVDVWSHQASLPNA